MPSNRENAGPSEMIIDSLISYHDHFFHGRPGIVSPDPNSIIGHKWRPVICKKTDEDTFVHLMSKRNRMNKSTKLGKLTIDNSVIGESGSVKGFYRPSGIYQEAVSWAYLNIANVFSMNNELVAKWGSYAFRQSHRDLKTILAAFLLVQNRKGDPVEDQGEILFRDSDFRNVGEAMVLRQEKGLDLSPKMVFRIWQILTLPEVVEINRKLGFGNSNKNPFLGRWPRATEKWLRFREENPNALEGIKKSGYKKTVQRLARIIGYKPNSDKFFEILGWKQKQSSDGRRNLAIGKEMEFNSWEGLSESDICNKIVTEKIKLKRIEGMLPSRMGITRAILAAAIESGGLSNGDLIIKSPTLEEMGLLEIKSIRKRWEKAVFSAENQRAANIAKNVSSKEIKNKLKKASDLAAQKEVKKSTKDLRVYFFVDVSSSMDGALDEAKPMISKLIQAIPLDKIHVAIFNTTGTKINIQHASEKGVSNAFRGIKAGGGTFHGAGIRCLSSIKPKENEDVLFIFVGDEQDREFSTSVINSGLNPLAFGLLKVPIHSIGRAVQDTAINLEIPCFMVSHETFEDPYAVPRVLRNLIESTPIRELHKANRVSLVDKIMKTELLQKPTWEIAKYSC